MKKENEMNPARVDILWVATIGCQCWQDSAKKCRIIEKLEYGNKEGLNMYQAKNRSVFQKGLTETYFAFKNRKNFLIKWAQANNCPNARMDTKETT